jgi:hypothetical protein
MFAQPYSEPSSRKRPDLDINGSVERPDASFAAY